MKKLTIISVFAIVLFLLSACGRTSGADDVPSVEDGRKLYVAKCAKCHGTDGSGGSNIGDVVSADLRAQTFGEKYEFNMALVSRAILDGVDNKGNALNAVMPRWRGKLSVEDTKAIIVYMQSLRVPPEPPTDAGSTDDGTVLTPDISQMRP